MDLKKKQTTKPNEYLSLVSAGHVFMQLYSNHNLFPKERCCSQEALCLVSHNEQKWASGIFSCLNTTLPCYLHCSKLALTRKYLFCAEPCKNLTQIFYFLPCLHFISWKWHLCFLFAFVNKNDRWDRMSAICLHSLWSDLAMKPFGLFPQTVNTHAVCHELSPASQSAVIFTDKSECCGSQIFPAMPTPFLERKHPRPKPRLQQICGV